ncbi:tail assembly chaperone [Mycobacterium phage Maxxinista]|uniref:Tail assembly chaperone n=5 Tax=Caudoviricetes TaxID=2731619 RepID=A0A1S5VY07_9CAUD|nr:tail assembly chaperone [Mycobacterium phage Pharsalus]AQP30865.1 tail assembly chaperone [Mycobacterium phage Maxxinista]QAY05210.1 tail assembly chaperone [Mycobacterium phage Czyszczon1]QAY16514.1 tail assembly chaperone [Mycobacterium phage Nimrod]QFP97200.1 tail assembly chaperone [Mycobacterium phage Kanye]
MARRVRAGFINSRNTIQTFKGNNTMAASKKQKRDRRVKLAEFRVQAIESEGALSSLEIEADNGEVFVIPHPLMLNDEEQERIEKHNRGDGLDREQLFDENGEPMKDLAGNPMTRIVEPHKINGVECPPAVVRSAIAIMGEETYARFKAAGGHANDVQLAWNYLVATIKEREEEDPKLLEAVRLLREYAAEIEVDLALKNIDIFDWYNFTKRKDGAPKLSSRRLLNIVYGGLDDKSVTKTAMREGDWSPDEYAQAATVNELRLLRADQAAISGRSFDVNLMKSPAQLKAEMEESQVKSRIQERISKQLNKGRRSG